MNQLPHQSASSVTPADRKTHCEGWRFHAAAVFVLGFLIRLWLIHSFPIVFGGDSIVRLANSDRILLSYQLPLLQAAIYSLSRLSDDVMLVRCFMAFVGSAAGVGFYLMTASLVGRASAFQSALLFTASPFVLAYSVVPYQEILMLAALFFAFYFFWGQNWSMASAALGLACLTRYEAWLACPVFVLAFAAERPRRLRGLLQGVALFGWAPFAWILFNAGITPAGTFAADTGISWERFCRYAYLGWITVKNTPLPVLALAAVGFWQCWRQGLLRTRRYQMLLVFLVLFLLAILLSAHGERDQPERFVSAREAHIPLSAVLVLAAIGLSRLRRYYAAFVAIGAFWGLVMAHQYVAREASDPHLRLSYQAAVYLDEHVRKGDTVVVLAKPAPMDLLQRFLDKAEERGGAIGRQKALEVLRQLDTSPPDYQRILVHSRLGRDQLQSLSSLAGNIDSDTQLPQTAGQAGTSVPDWIVRFSDFDSGNPAESKLQNLTNSKAAVYTLQDQEVQVRFYRPRKGGPEGNLPPG